MSTDGPVTLITSGHVPDDAAVASVPALRAAGRHFGEDLLLASCVDSTPLAHADPPITAIDPRPRDAHPSDPAGVHAGGRGAAGSHGAGEPVTGRVELITDGAETLAVVEKTVRADSMATRSPT